MPYPYTLRRTISVFPGVASCCPARLPVLFDHANLGTVPGNYQFSPRRMLISSANYADYAFLFTLHCGDPLKRHLDREYPAVLDTDGHTPCYMVACELAR